MVHQVRLKRQGERRRKEQALLAKFNSVGSCYVFPRIPAGTVIRRCVSEDSLNVVADHVGGAVVVLPFHDTPTEYINPNGSHLRYVYAGAPKIAVKFRGSSIAVGDLAVHAYYPDNCPIKDDVLMLPHVSGVHVFEAAVPTLFKRDCFIEENFRLTLRLNLHFTGYEPGEVIGVVLSRRFMDMIYVP
jgi:hypothetical protein